MKKVLLCKTTAWCWQKKVIQLQGFWQQGLKNGPQIHSTHNQQWMSLHGSATTLKPTTDEVNGIDQSPGLHVDVLCPIKPTHTLSCWRTGVSVWWRGYGWGVRLFGGDGLCHKWWFPAGTTAVQCYAFHLSVVLMLWLIGAYWSELSAFVLQAWPSCWS